MKEKISTIATGKKGVSVSNIYLFALLPSELRIRERQVRPTAVTKTALAV